MKLTFRSCQACGFEGHEGQVRVMVVEVPEDERVPVTVAIPVSFRVGAVDEQRQVEGRYAAELRCTDVGACALRVAALTPEQRGEVVVVEPESAPGDGLAAWAPADIGVGGSKLPAEPVPQDRSAATNTRRQNADPKVESLDDLADDDGMAAWT